MDIFGFHIPKNIFVSIVIVLVSILLYVIAALIIGKITRREKKKGNKRRTTLLILVRKIIKYVILVLAIVTILNTFKVNTTALVTSIGAVSLVIGLAFQDLLKDMLVGMAIIFEEQFNIGDIIKVGDFKGEVVSFSLKSTRIKSLTGEVKIIANREITSVINYSNNKNTIITKINVAYEEDNRKVEDILKKVCQKMTDESEGKLEYSLIDGIEALDDSSVVYSIKVLANAEDALTIKRDVLKHVKEEFDKQKIKIPYMQVEVHNEK
jgi:small conductance mechanosensitive channel